MIRNIHPKKSIRGVLILVAACIGIAVDVSSHEVVSCSAHQVMAENITQSQQGATELQPYSPANCETALHYLEDAVLEARKTNDAYIIAILRLGSGESANRYRSRHNHMKEYLERFYGERVVVAQGERVRGLGRIELYVNGRLFNALEIDKNVRSICTGNLGY